MVVAQTVGILGIVEEIFEGFQFTIKSVQAMVGGNSEEAVFGFDDGVSSISRNMVTADAVGIFRNVLESFKLVGFLIKSAQASSKGSNPNEALFIFEEFCDSVNVGFYKP